MGVVYLVPRTCASSLARAHAPITTHGWLPTAQTGKPKRILPSSMRNPSATKASSSRAKKHRGPPSDDSDADAEFAAKRNRPADCAHSALAWRRRSTASATRTGARSSRSTSPPCPRAAARRRSSASRSCSSRSSPSSRSCRRPPRPARALRMVARQSEHAQPTVARARAFTCASVRCQATWTRPSTTRASHDNSVRPRSHHVLTLSGSCGATARFSRAQYT